MTPLSILVVDDDPTIRALLSRALLMLGLNPVIAQDGNEAVDLFRVNEISVVLLDVELPVIDGPETLKRLHAIRPVACVFMTAGSAYSNDELFAFGACDVIRKPFGNLDALAGILKGCFEKETLNHAAHPRGQPHVERKKTQEK